MSKDQPTPISVTILGMFVLFITFWNALRGYGAVANWQVLTEFEANPTYILATGTGWALIGLLLVVTIWRRSRFAIRANLLVSIAYYVWYWCDRLFVQSSSPANYLFSAVFSTVLLALFCTTICMPSAKAFFDKEQE